MRAAQRGDPLGAADCGVDAENVVFYIGIKSAERYVLVGHQHLAATNLLEGARGSDPRALGPAPPRFLRGETRLESYRPPSTSCATASASPSPGERASGARTLVLLGMRVLGYLTREAPNAGLTHEWRPGACAVLGKPEENHGAPRASYAVALTSPTTSCETRRANMPPPLPHRRTTLTRVLPYAVGQ